MLDSCKMVEKQSEAFHTFLLHFFQVENTILLHIVFLKCQIAFLKFSSCDNRALVGLYSNSCCSCWFEHESIKIDQSSHKMYSNKIVNFQESTTILNAHTKKVWKLIVCTSYIFILVCACVCVCVFDCVVLFGDVNKNNDTVTGGLCCFRYHRVY